MPPAELWVALCSDTEDNYPSYVPGWKLYGSNYDCHDASLRLDWTQYWHVLSEQFRRSGFPITWLIRVDDGPMCTVMPQRFKTEILRLRSEGDEIGIHIHTYFWDPQLFIWRQTKDAEHEARIVRRSIEYFREILGFNPLSVRMGWNAMSNGIMETLNHEGILVDASGIPGIHCKGKYGKRDNIFDWKNAPDEPYHPSTENYSSGGKMKILEIPVSVVGRSDTNSKKMVEKISNTSTAYKTMRLLPLIRRFSNFNPNPFFYISPWWSISIINKIINKYVQKARKNGTAFLVGFFHSSDILDPRTGGENLFFKLNIEHMIQAITEIKGAKVRYLTLSQCAQEYERMNTQKIEK